MDVYVGVDDGRVWARARLKQIMYKPGPAKVILDGATKSVVLPDDEMLCDDDLTVDDLCELSHVHEATILDAIERRFKMEKPYTAAGEVILAVNPNKWLDIYTKKDREKKAHVYAVSSAALRGARRGEDQSVLVSGESGAGKTETVKLVLAHLADVGNASEDIVHRVLVAGPLLESFGNAATVRNGNSSRFAKFLRVAFKDNVLTGSWTETALLEKTRVVSYEGERSFHVFYEIGGLPRSALGKARGKSDEQAYKEMVASLASFTPVEPVLRCVKAVLGVLQGDGSLLGCDLTQLKRDLTTRQVRGVTLELSPQEQVNARHALAKELYARLFDVIVEKSSDARQEGVIIGLLDLFGFETYKTNGFSQFLINYANERLQQRFVSDVLAKAQEELVEEGVPWHAVDFEDNSEILRLIEGRAGLIDILNEECIRSGDAFVEKILTFYKGNPLLSTPKIRQERVFVIAHYAGTVLYKDQDWVDSNKDALSFGLTPTEEGPASLIKKRGGRLQPSETVASKFRAQLKQLMTAISETKCHYIRCIRPGTPFDRVSVVEQLRCCGVLSALRVARAGYPDRKPLGQFVERYGMIQGITDDAQKLIHMIDARRKLNLATRVFIGKTKVFLRDGALDEMERLREEACYSSAVLLQAVVRSFVLRSKFQRARKGFTTLQSLARAMRAKKRVKLARVRRNAVVVIQAFARFSLARSVFPRARTAATTIQANIARPILARKRVQAQKVQKAKTRRLDTLTSKLKDLSKKDLGGIASDAQQALDDLRKENAALRERCAAAEARAEAWRSVSVKSKQREAQLLAMIKEKKPAEATQFSRLKQQLLTANINPTLKKRILSSRQHQKTVTVTQSQLKEFRNKLLTSGIHVIKHSLRGRPVKRVLRLTDKGELYWERQSGFSRGSKELYPLTECIEVRAASDVDPDITSKVLCATKTLRRSMEAKNWPLAFSFIFNSRTIDIQLPTPDLTKSTLRLSKALVQEARAKALKQLMED